MSRRRAAVRAVARQPVVPEQSRWLLLVAIAGTVLAVALRLYSASVLGPLWRDEAGSAATASVATFTEFLARQHYDSFPLLWQLLLRGWTTVLWNDGDVAIRSFGLLISLLLLPALWWTSRALAIVPLASLLFVGVAPTFVIWAGIQNRAYGLGVVLVALLIGAVWRLVAAPGTRSTILATVVAVLAVQTTYHNPVMVAALLGAAAVVGIRRRSAKLVVSAAVVGVVAALSLLIYLDVLAETRGLAKLVYAQVSFASIVKGLYVAVASGGTIAGAGFMILVAGACVWGWVVVARSSLATSVETEDAREAVTFAAVAATLALLGQAAFLAYLRFLVQPWYYATVVLVVAVAIDVVVQRGIAVARWRDAVTGAIAVLLLIATISGAVAVDRRQSNIDLIAHYLQSNARPGDLIVVYPWHYGLSFDRYYKGAVPFMTIPDVEGHEYHRFDQLERLMRDPELIKPGYRRIYQTLAAGNGVWVVGRPTDEVPPVFPAPPVPRDDDPSSWRDGFYTALAGLQLAWVLQQAAPQVQHVPPLTEARVQDLEDASLTLYSKTPR